MKESVTKFDLSAAFKALDELDFPAVESTKKSQTLNETVGRKLKTDVLCEDYFDISNSEDMEAAQKQREQEIAAAKLARIEKIVDLDADSPEDLLPSYKGKIIIQCPQCMTMFYKNKEDVVESEDDANTVNVGEKCQHCGHEGGYTVIGKVAGYEEETAAEEPTEAPVEDENTLDLDFDLDAAEPTEEAASEETVEEAPAEETPVEETGEEEADIDLNAVEGEETEEEEVKESLNESAVSSGRRLPQEVIDQFVIQRAVDAVDQCGFAGFDLYKNLTPERYGDLLDTIGNNSGWDWDDLKYWYTEEAGVPQINEVSEEDYLEFAAALWNASIDEAEETINKFEAEHEGEETINYGELYSAVEDIFRSHIQLAEGCETCEEDCKEELTEATDKELDAKLKEHNDYITYLQNAIDDANKELEKAKNDEVKAAIQKKIDSLTQDLHDALPEAVKNDIAASEDLPTAEEAGIENATENVEEVVEDEVKESLTEAADKNLTAGTITTEEGTVIECKVEDGDVTDGNAESFYLDRNNANWFVKELNATLTDGDEIVYDNVSDSYIGDLDTFKKDKETGLYRFTGKDNRGYMFLFPFHKTPLTESVNICISIDDICCDEVEDNCCGTFDCDFPAADVSVDELEVKPVFDAPFCAIGDDCEVEDAIADESEVKDEVDAKIEDNFPDPEPMPETEAEEKEEETESDEDDIEELDEDFNRIFIEKDEVSSDDKFYEVLNDLVGDGDDNNWSATFDDIAADVEKEALESARDEHKSYYEKLGNKEYKDYREFLEAVISTREDLLKSEEITEGCEECNENLTPAEAFEEMQNIVNEGCEEKADELTEEANDKLVFNQAEVDKMLDSDEFQHDISDEAVEEMLDDDITEDFNIDDLNTLEEVDDDELKECIEQSLTEVYENVKSFELTNCSIEDNKFIVEGLVTFASNNKNTVTYTFTEAKKNRNNTRIRFTGTSSIANDGQFILEAAITNENKNMLAENLFYSYKVNETLVEGLTGKEELTEGPIWNKIKNGLNSLGHKAADLSNGSKKINSYFDSLIVIPRKPGNHVQGEIIKDQLVELKDFDKAIDRALKLSKQSDVGIVTVSGKKGGKETVIISYQKGKELLNKVKDVLADINSKNDIANADVKAKAAADKAAADAKKAAEKAEEKAKEAEGQLAKPVVDTPTEETAANAQNGQSGAQNTETAGENTPAEEPKPETDKNNGETQNAPVEQPAAKKLPTKDEMVAALNKKKATAAAKIVEVAWDKLSEEEKQSILDKFTKKPATETQAQ